MRLAAMYRLLSLALLPLLVTQRAAAHGAPPAALAVLGWDEQGATSVRLSQGIAQRTREGFRYVCPEAWGGDALAPAAALPGGPTLIAAVRLFVLEADGRVSPHPEDVGEGIALARGGDALYGLFSRDGRVELRRLEATHSELVHSFEEPLSALTASASMIAVMHYAQRTLVVQKLSPQGELGERVSWDAPSAVAFAELRSANDQLYAAIWGRSAPWVTLGRVSAQGYEPLREAQSSIAGPLALEDGAAVVLDGAPELLDGEGELALMQGDGAIQCLDSLAGRAYACVHAGLWRFDARGVGEPLFQLASLREPDYQLLREAYRADCAFRWRDVREHVAELNAEANAAVDAGAAEADDPDAVGRDAADAARPADNPAADGCALGARAARSQGWLPAALLALILVRRARRGAISGSSSGRKGS
jgi:hypothetical protein